ncbi:MAG: ABC transporter ATP-binding protein [Anaerolineales bacterium]|nr:ABC transporter ATP-binding protein [Anaerolineales bacterium]
MKEKILEAIHLTKEFTGAEKELRALGEVSFSIAREEFVCVVGPSGCGKSTLLRLLGGLLRPTAGEVLFEGRALAGPSPRIGFMFQLPNLMPWRSVERNIRLPLELDGTPEAEARAAVKDLVKLVGLTGFEGSLPRELSGGMAQRVALARALAHDPEVLLLDEPFGALDAMTRDRMGAELMRIARDRRKTVVMVTHSIPEAILMADRVLALTSRPGRLRLDLAVGLPRPRREEMTYTKKFGAMAERIRAAIGEAV